MSEGHIIDNYFAVNYSKNDQDNLVHFLTHIETGLRTQDLKNIISTTASTVFTSATNAYILKVYFNYDHNIVPIELGKSYQVNTKNQKMFIFTCLKSYYNCGSMILIARGDFGTIIYTGFAASDVGVLNLPVIKEIIYQESLTKLYLDCTYYKSCVEFFSVSDIKKIMVEFFQSRKNRFYIHVPVFGLEDLLGYIAMSLEEKMVVDEKRMMLINNLGLSKFFTVNNTKGRLFIISQEIMKRNIENEVSQLVYIKVVNELSNNSNSYMTHGKIHFFTIYPHCTNKDCSEIISIAKPDFLFPLGWPDTKESAVSFGSRLKNKPCTTSGLSLGSSKGKSVIMTKRTKGNKKVTSEVPNKNSTDMKHKSFKKRPFIASRGQSVTTERNVRNLKSKKKNSTAEVSKLNQAVDLTKEICSESASMSSVSGNSISENSNSCLPNKKGNLKLTSSSSTKDDNIDKRLDEVISKINRKYFTNTSAKLSGCQDKFSNILLSSKNEIDKVISKTRVCDEEYPTKLTSSINAPVSEETSEDLMVEPNKCGDHLYARPSKFLTILRKTVPAFPHGSETVFRSDSINSKGFSSVAISGLASGVKIDLLENGDKSVVPKKHGQETNQACVNMNKVPSELSQYVESSVALPVIVKSAGSLTPMDATERVKYKGDGTKQKMYSTQLHNNSALLQCDLPSTGFPTHRGSSNAVKIALEIEGIVKSKLEVDKTNLLDDQVKKSIENNVELSKEAEKKKQDFLTQNEPLTSPSRSNPDHSNPETEVKSALTTPSKLLDPLKVSQNTEETTRTNFPQDVNLVGRSDGLKLDFLKSVPQGASSVHSDQEEVAPFDEEVEQIPSVGSTVEEKEIFPNDPAVDKNGCLDKKKSCLSFNGETIQTFNCDLMKSDCLSKGQPEFANATMQPPPLTPILKQIGQVSKRSPLSSPPSLKKMLKVAVFPFSPSNSNSQKTVTNILKKEQDNSKPKVFLTGKSLIIPSSMVLPQSAVNNSPNVATNVPTNIRQIKYIRLSKKKISNIISTLKDQLDSCSNDESCKVVRLSPKKHVLGENSVIDQLDSCLNDENCKVVHLSPKKQGFVENSVIELSDDDSSESTSMMNKNDKPCTSNLDDVTSKKNVKENVEQGGISFNLNSVAATTPSRLKVKQLSDLLPNPSLAQDTLSKEVDIITDKSLSNVEQTKEVILGEKPSETSNFKTMEKSLNEGIENSNCSLDSSPNENGTPPKMRLLNEIENSEKAVDNCEKTVKSIESQGCEIKTSARKQLKVKPLSNLLSDPSLSENYISKTIETPPGEDVEKIETSTESTVDKTKSSSEGLNDNSVGEDTEKDGHPDSACESLDKMVSEFLTIKKRRKRRKSVWFRNIHPKRRACKGKVNEPNVSNDSCTHSSKSSTDNDSSHESHLDHNESVPNSCNNILDNNVDEALIVNEINDADNKNNLPQAKVASNVSDLMNKLKSSKTDLDLLKKFNIVQEPVVLLPNLNQSGYTYDSLKDCFVLNKNLQGNKRETLSLSPRKKKGPFKISRSSSESDETLEPTSSYPPISDKCELLKDSASTEHFPKIISPSLHNPSEPNVISRKPKVKGVVFKTLKVSGGEKPLFSNSRDTKNSTSVVKCNLDSSASLNNPSSLHFERNDSFKKNSNSLPCISGSEISKESKMNPLRGDRPFKLSKCRNASFIVTHNTRSSEVKIGRGSLLVSNEKPQQGLFGYASKFHSSKDKNKVNPPIIPINNSKFNFQPVQGSFIVVDISKQTMAAQIEPKLCVQHDDTSKDQMPLITGVVSLSTEASSSNYLDPQASKTGSNLDSIYTSYDDLLCDKSDQAALSTKR